MIIIAMFTCVTLPMVSPDLPIMSPSINRKQFQSEEVIKAWRPGPCLDYLLAVCAGPYQIWVWLRTDHGAQGKLIPDETASATNHHHHATIARVYCQNYKIRTLSTPCIKLIPRYISISGFQFAVYVSHCVGRANGDQTQY